MDEPKVLTYRREQLVETLKARQAEREQERQRKADEAKARNQRTRDAIVEALDTHPMFLVWLNGAMARQFGEANTASHPEAFKLALERQYGAPAGGEAPVEEWQDPDADLKRLIRVYENAVDETVKVDVASEVYRHL